MPAVGNTAGGYRDPVDAALLAVQEAVGIAVREGAGRGEILSRVANGLTGSLNGYRERLLTTALVGSSFAADLTQDEARAIERRLRS